MSSPAERQDESVVQIVCPADNWVLEHLARRLAAKLPYARLVPWKPQPSHAARLAYYLNYALYHGPSGLIDVAFFTHYDATQQFLERARRVDFCISMSQLYADWLRDHGVTTVAHIPMGFDAYRYRPRLVLGVIGKLDHPRKGRHLVERLRTLPFVEIVTTEGKVAETQLRDLYQRLDYVLIPATVEGGPMSLLEGLGMGKPVIAPGDVGLVPEFGATEHIRRYPAGDGAALVRVVTACYQEKLERTRLVADRTWDRWAEAHHQLFGRLLGERGLALPSPAPGFRFGLLDELEIPWGLAVDGLEALVDGAAAALYHGRYRAARMILTEAVAHYPWAGKLLETIPKEDPAPSPQRVRTTPAHALALR